jgi:hypothetical protein
MTRKTLHKTYISTCANGELELLQEMISKNHSLLQVTVENRYSEVPKNGLYYAVRNLKYNTTDFLLNSGLTITERTIKLFIQSEWRASLESYKFVNHFKNSLCKDVDLSKDLFLYYKSFCLSNNEIRKFIRILEHEKFDINSQSLTNLLNEYIEYKKNSNSPSYISNLRELQLRILLLDQ